MSDTPADDLRENILFWLDRMLETTYEQSEKEMHIITAGITADQLLGVVAQHEAKLLQGLLAEMPELDKTTTDEFTYEYGHAVAVDQFRAVVNAELKKVTEE